MIDLFKYFRSFHREEELISSCEAPKRLEMNIIDAYKRYKRYLYSFTGRGYKHWHPLTNEKLK